MGASILNFSRSLKADIARQIVTNLKERQQNGPAEPVLDAFIPELENIVVELDTHVQGKHSANALREAQLGRLERADIDVDTWYRHLVSFLDIEAKRRGGPYVEKVAGLYKAACPDGLAHVDGRIVDENAYCRGMLSVLRAPEHQAIVKAIELPPKWLDRLESALDESDAASEEVIKARGATSDHVDLGREAEAEWYDAITRLRRYVNSRAKRNDVAKRNEGQQLLRPLLDAQRELTSKRAARATRRANTAASQNEDPKAA